MCNPKLIFFFALAKAEGFASDALVPWMSGLVSGLQNRVRRFESARNLSFNHNFMHERLIILDFGSQTTQLIGRRVRELNMYCEIVPYNKFPHDATDVKGVILSGSPYSVYDENAFKADLTQIRGKYPVLGICYGAQFLAYMSGGKVEPANSREYGRANLTTIQGEDPLLKDIPVGSQIWMSHGDTITALPENFKIIASTDDVQAAAYHVEGILDALNAGKIINHIDEKLDSIENTIVSGFKYIKNEL